MANYSRLFQLDPDIDEQLKKRKLLAPAADMPDLFEGSGQHGTVMQAAAEESARTQQAIGGAVKQGYERMKREQKKATAGSAPVGMPTAPSQPPIIEPREQTIRGGGPVPEQVPIPDKPIPDVVADPVLPPGQPTGRPESSPSAIDAFITNQGPTPQAQNSLFMQPSGPMETAPDLSAYKQEYWKPQGVPNMNPAVKKYRNAFNYDWGGGMAQGGLVYGGRRGRKVRIGEEGEETLLIPPGSEAMVVPDQNFQSPDIRKIAERADVPGDPGGYDGWEHPAHPNPLQGLIARRDRNLDLAGMGSDVYQPPGADIGSTDQMAAPLTPPRMLMEGKKKGTVVEAGPRRMERDRIRANRAIYDIDVPEQRDRAALDERAQRGPEKKGVWSRLGRGFQWGVENWKADGGPGGLGGYLGSGIAGLTTYGLSPKTQAEVDYQKDMSKLMSRYKTTLQPQLADMELQQIQAKTASAQYDATGKRWEAVLKQNAPLIDMVKASKMSTPQQVAYFKSIGIPMDNFDYREYDITWDKDGNPYVYPKSGVPVATPAPGHPVNPDKMYTTATIDDGKGGKSDFLVKPTTAFQGSIDLKAAQGREQQQNKVFTANQLHQKNMEAIEQKKFDYMKAKDAVELETKLITEQSKLLGDQSKLAPVYGELTAAAEEYNSLIGLHDASTMANGANPENEELKALNPKVIEAKRRYTAALTQIEMALRNTEGGGGVLARINELRDKLAAAGGIGGTPATRPRQAPVQRRVAPTPGVAPSQPYRRRGY